MTKYWLMKSEPSSYSIDDLQRDKTTKWDGVRNFQARNFMRDEMNEGDFGLFYHSNAKPSGVYGVFRIVKTKIPDITALDPTSKYYDPKATQDNPIWFLVEVKFIEKFQNIFSIQQLKETTGLENLKTLQKGSRLSITPVKKNEFEIITNFQNLSAKEEELINQKTM
jgi:predicted RNA-binding protein with PUA-like domain